MSERRRLRAQQIRGDNATPALGPLHAQRTYLLLQSRLNCEIEAARDHHDAQARKRIDEQTKE